MTSSVTSDVVQRQCEQRKELLRDALVLGRLLSRRPVAPVLQANSVVVTGVL